MRSSTGQWTRRVTVAMLVSLGALYLGLFAFISLSGFGPIGRIAAGTLAMCAVCLFQMSLPAQAHWPQTVLANALLMALFTFVIVLDGLFCHPGLAKDVQGDAAALTEYILNLLILMTVPGAILGSALHRCLTWMRRSGPRWQKASNCTSP